MERGGRGGEVDCWWVNNSKLLSFAGFSLTPSENQIYMCNFITKELLKKCIEEVTQSSE